MPDYPIDTSKNLFDTIESFRLEATQLAEALRAERLNRLGVLGTVDPMLDQLVELAAVTTNLPSAVLTFIGDDYAFIKSSFNGPPLGEEDRSIAFCNTTIEQENGTLLVPNASEDARFKDNPKVKSGMIACYAGATVKSPDGVPLGALCIGSNCPYRVRDDQLQVVQKFADLVSLWIAERLEQQANASTQTGQ